MVVRVHGCTCDGGEREGDVRGAGGVVLGQEVRSVGTVGEDRQKVQGDEGGRGVGADVVGIC